MATFRVSKDKNYTTINNTGLRDERLTWKAKGILAYILSLPDDWVFYMEEVATHSKDKLDSLKSGIKELKEHGYVKRYPVKNEKGKIARWEMIIYEVPQGEKPQGEKPQGEKPQGEKPQGEKPQGEKP
ncbi:helix-turn-helix domain-containing protein, partial [Bacillus mycoides]|uniref:helix-turn-helix domain-containing protein n=1 Tax=Bacillus mycoides TaxID=1405 RepID=UPI003CFE8CDB